MGEITKKAVIYCRVSDPKQVKEGHGLTSQETRCREFAKYRNHEVVEVFQEEGISGGLIDRPAMKRMLAYLRQHKKEALVVIIDDISRLARDLKAHIELRMAIQEAGGILQSPSIEFGQDSDSQLVENMLASVSQHHRQKNAEQVKNRMRARMLNGYWILCAPRGYKVEKCGAHGKMLVRDEPLASIIKEGLEGFAHDRFGTPVEVQLFFQSQPCFPKDKRGKVHLQRVLDILNRQLYSGYYEYPEWDIKLMKGKHEPIISFETFKAIEDKLQERAKVPARKDISLDFPLRGFILCECCEAPLTACWAHGRSGKYAYYHCRTRGCEQYGKSVKKEDMEGEFEQLLKDLTPTPQVITCMQQIIDELRDKKTKHFKDYLGDLENQVVLIDRKVEQLVERIMAADSQTLINTYERQMKQMEEQRIIFKEKIQKCGTLDKGMDESVRTGFKFLENPHEYWVGGQATGAKSHFFTPLGIPPPKGI
jgi:site-specific DNA recombinase